MGLFFNYNKPGPGVDKNAPKKKGAALFFELFLRYFGKLLLSNMLYFVVSLPVLAIYAMIVTSFLVNIMPEAVGTVGFMQTIIIQRQSISLRDLMYCSGKKEK